MSKKKRKHSSAATIVEPVEYDYHLPVMLNECLDNLVLSNKATIIDGTLGGGGHAEGILSRLDSGGNLVAFDKDSGAIAHSKRKFSTITDNQSAPKITFYNECFSSICNKAEYDGKIDGVLLDLGVSSMQLDSDSVGLSYRFNARLDMRFGNEGIPAYDIINKADVAEIKRILRDYGEEPKAGLIARRIDERRRAIPLETTFDLKELIEELVSPTLRFKTLSRVFQAFRIAVNRELEVLEKALHCYIKMLAPQGRIVVMSYHSLEDRIVKNIFREYDKHNNDKPLLKIITSKPIIASDDEIAKNPRARSAKLRIAEKL
ncbi:16S rRNA (cytosine(1402)-N(4))-methyltransferase RsmH [Candidatus Kapaibacterium sp.]